MNQKLIVNIEVEQDGLNFTFSMPYGFALGSAYNAGIKVLEQLIEMSKQQVENAKPKEAASPTTGAPDGN